MYDFFPPFLQTLGMCSLISETWIDISARREKSSISQERKIISYCFKFVRLFSRNIPTDLQFFRQPQLLSGMSDLRFASSSGFDPGCFSTESLRYNQERYFAHVGCCPLADWSLEVNMLLTLIICTLNASILLNLCLPLNLEMATLRS